MSVVQSEQSTAIPYRQVSPTYSKALARVILALGPLPLVMTFVIQLWHQRPHYQFVPVYLVALTWLCWFNRPKELQFTGLSSGRHRAFLILGLILFGSAALLFSPWLGMAGWLLILPAAFIDLLSPVALRKLVPIWLISWFVLPPPFHWDEELLQWLRTRTSAATGVVLDALGVIYIQAGNTFEVPGKQFFIEDACSGIHSLLSIVGLALLWSVYLRLPVFAAICSVISAAAAAVALNIVRVLAVVLAWSRWELDLSKGWQHELLGVVLFATALLFLASAQQFWLFWFSPLPEKFRRRPAVQPSVTGPSNLEEKIPTDPRWLKWGAAMAIFLWVPQLIHCAVALSPRPTLAASLDPRRAATEVSENSLPKELRGWKQVEYREVVRARHHQEGEFSRQWTYQTPSGLVQVSFDFPFGGPHPLLRCYEATGWQASVQRTVSADSSPGGFQQAALKRREFEVASLIYGVWDDRGALVTPLVPVDRSAPQPLAKRIWNRLVPIGPAPTTKPLNTYQFQVLVTREFPLSDAENAELVEFFLAARDELLRRFVVESPTSVEISSSNSN